MGEDPEMSKKDLDQNGFKELPKENLTVAIESFLTPYSYILYNRGLPTARPQILHINAFLKEYVLL